ncbi:MAG: tyrosine-protein kinase family protein [Ktedonobacteraceae bacterium]
MSAYIEIKKESWRTRSAPFTRLLLRWGWFVLLLMIVVTVASSIIPDSASSTGYQAELQVQVELLGSAGINNAKDATKFFIDTLSNPDTLNLALPKLAKLPQFKGLQLVNLESLVVISDIKKTNLLSVIGVSDSPQDATIIARTVFQAFLDRIHKDRSQVVNGLVAALNFDLAQVESDEANSAATLQGLKATGKIATPAYSFIADLHNQQTHRADHINALLLQLQQQGFGPNDILKLDSNTPVITTVPGTGPTQSQRLALSPLIGLIMGLGGIVLANHFSNSVPLRGKRREEVLPRINAVFPRLPKLSENRLRVLERTSSECLPLLRRLRYQSSEFEKPLHVITVTSPKRREGKSTLASSLAFASAKSGMRTILVDANVARPVVHSWFHIPNSSGTLDVTNALVAGMPGPLPLVSTSVAELGVLPIGVRQPGVKKQQKTAGVFDGDLRSDGLRPFIDVLSSQADLIVIDGPSLLTDVGAANLLMLSDAVLLTVDAQKSKSTQVLEAEDILSKLKVPFSIVLNRTMLKTVG